MRWFLGKLRAEFKRTLCSLKGWRSLSTVRMTLRWFVPTGESGAIASALHDLMVAAREEPGYVSCQLSSEVGRQVGLQYVEEWAKEEDLHRQLRSDRFTRLAELVERASERPSVEFLVGLAVHGLEYAVNVRGTGSTAQSQDASRPTT
jgi:quinol monooxygenase YgiN